MVTFSGKINHPYMENNVVAVDNGSAIQFVGYLMIMRLWTFVDSIVIVCGPKIFAAQWQYC